MSGLLGTPKPIRPDDDGNAGVRRHRSGGRCGGTHVLPFSFFDNDDNLLPLSDGWWIKVFGVAKADRRHPAVGIGYRSAIAAWTRANLKCFDLLEVTIDHCIYGSAAQCAEIFDLVGCIPINAHGIGLSIGTDVPLDLAYLDQVAAIVDRLHAPTYSEHLAFTRVPGRDLANLLPLPRTMAAAESIVAKVRAVQSRLGVPFLLENISYAFEWPDSNLSDADFLNLICRESGAGLLLDIENLYLNSQNHGFDAHEFLDELAPDLVREVHMAGGIAISDAGLQRSFLADTHSHPVPNETLDLLQYALSLYAPQTIILERDDRLEATDEILADVERIRLCVDQRSKYVQGKGIVGSASSPARIPD